MTYDIYLKEPQASVPASKQKATPLLVVVSHRNRKFKKNLGISVLPRDFVKGKTKDERVNLRLRKVRACLAENLTDLSTEEEIAEVLEKARCLARGEEYKKKEDSRIPTFSEYLEEWWPRGGTSCRQRKLFMNNIKRFMGDGIKWTDVDDRFFFRFSLKMEENDFAVNYKAKQVGQLKAVMEEGRKLRYHSLLDYKDWAIVRELPDTIYLTQDEIDRIWNVKLTGSMRNKARDLFILGVYTVARFSDYSRLSDEIIRDGMIHFIHQKTKASVYVPVAPRVREVLDRNGGKAPRLSQQKFNDYIKVVCREAGIDSIVEHRGKDGTVRMEKYKLVTSHTARRTGATLLRLNGASMREIMLIGGWASEKTLERYLRISKEENASRMLGNPFFR